MTTAPGKMCYPLLSQVLKSATESTASLVLGTCARDGEMCGRPGQGVRPFRATSPKATI
jgi:hypothetical protein